MGCARHYGAFLIGAAALWAQVPQWTVIERWLLPSGDTLVRQREAGQWWVGVGGGTSGIGYLGQLNLPRSPDVPERGLLPFRSGMGSGIGFWLAGEWNPPGERWGVMLRLIPWESWRGSSRFQPVGSLTDEHYEVELQARSFVLSGSARYTPGWWRGTLWEGFHVLAGIDARFLWDARERVRQVFRNAERVEEWRLQREQPLPLWLGVHVGVGVDIIVALFGGQLRNYVTPMVVLQTGLPLQRTWGSTWTPLALQAGLTFKLGWERVHQQLLPVDTTAGLFVAGVSDPGEGRAPRLLTEERLSPAPLAVVELPPSEVQPAQSPAPSPARRFQILPNRVQRFSYPTPTAVGITPELQQYLDALVEYLRSNPSAEVRIIGHTDEFGGTLEETQSISEQRAQQVVEYLVRRGISRSRLFASGVGARQPIADNRTAEGRLRNRRVDIIVVQ